MLGVGLSAGEIFDCDAPRKVMDGASEACLGRGRMVGDRSTLFICFHGNACPEMNVKSQTVHPPILLPDASVLKTIEGARLECEVRNHPALASVMHLLPENVLVSGDENIPGLAASPTGKAHITETT